MRSLYAYEGQRDEDVSFLENLVVIVHPAKDPNHPWVFGTVEISGKQGWLPSSYVEQIHRARSSSPCSGILLTQT